MLVYTLRLALDCNGCKNPMPVNGITAVIDCARCGEHHELDAKFWTTVVTREQLDAAAQMGEGEGQVSKVIGQYTYELAYGRRTPRCQRCKGPNLEPATLAGFSAAGHCFCPKCGEPVRVRAADDLVRAIAPAATLVVGEMTLTSEEQALNRKKKPVLFPCMGCGGTLDIDGSRRSVECKFCQATNYLPDGLWQQVNPVPKLTVFFVVC